MRAKRASYIQERVVHSLLQTVQYFQMQQDKNGMEEFLFFIDNLELYIQEFMYSEERKGYGKKLQSVLALLLEQMKNEDFLGVVESLEYSMYPIISKMQEGSEKT